MLSTLLLAVLASAPQSDPSRLVSVDLTGVGPRTLQRLDLDFVAHGRPLGGELGPRREEIVAHDRDLARLARLRIPHEILVEDLEAFYASRLSVPTEAAGPYGTWLSPAFGQGSMGGYYTLAEVESVLDQISAAFPTIATAKTSLGSTLEGRSQWMIKVSDNPGLDENEPEVRIDSLHHAREPEGMQASLWFLLFLLEEYGSDPLATYLVEERELYFVPVVNPDGYVYNHSTNPNGGGLWRKNRRDNGDGTTGVDLNRNYPSQWGYDNSGSSPSGSSQTFRGSGPASEPEVQNMVAFLAGRQFATALSVHTYSNLWLYPLGYIAQAPLNDAEYAEISILATAVNGYTWGPASTVLYLANGVTIDHDHLAHGSLSWTPEIGGNGDGFWPPTARIVPLAEENLLAFQRTALAAGAWVRHLDTDVADAGDGDGFFEPGEPVELTLSLRNSGRNDTSGGITVSLTTTSPYASVTQASAMFGDLTTFSEGDHAQQPLALSILPGTPGGTSVDYVLAFEYEGWTQELPGSLAVGEPLPFLLDDLEVDLGWRAGQVGDTALRGLWEYGIPIGTSSSGQPVNPGQDATPAPGQWCLMTGNGGGSAGTDDVDDGFTTLISPAMDLSSVAAATLSYSRWYALLTTADDVFEVSISADDGASWSPLESVTNNQNQWTRVSFDLGAFLSDRVRLRFVASDDPNNSLVEAAVDDLEVLVYESAPRLNLYGDVTAGGSVRANVTGPAGAEVHLIATLEDPGTAGATPPAHAISFQPTGFVPAARLAQLPFAVPADPLFSGRRLWVRAAVGSSGSYQWSNWAALDVP